MLRRVKDYIFGYQLVPTDDLNQTTQQRHACPQPVQPKYVISSFVLVFIVFTMHLMYNADMFGKLETGSFGQSTDASQPANGSETLAKRLPQCIIVGIRKCGTRALLEFLNLHPKIVATPNEVHYFDKMEHYSLGTEWYLQQMAYSTPDQITIEKSPAYFITPLAPKRIFHMNRDIKLLFIVRNPTRRTISDYTQIQQLRKSMNASMPPFEYMVVDPLTGQVKKSYKAIQISMYSKHVVNWLGLFPRSQMHFVDGDQLISNPVPELKKVETFLEIPSWFKQEHFYMDHTKGFYCLRNETNKRCLGKSKGRPHPEVAPVILHKLDSFFKPYNAKFFSLIGQVFNWTTTM